MKCPVCSDPPGSQLVMSERAGVEIDYCPTCRGVWLDRGELDKILERAAAELAVVAAPAPMPAPAPVPAIVPAYRQAPPPRYRDDDDDDYYKRQGGYPRKKKSFLSELFD